MMSHQKGADSGWAWLNQIKAPQRETEVREILLLILKKECPAVRGLGEGHMAMKCGQLLGADSSLQLATREKIRTSVL